VAVEGFKRAAPSELAGAASIVTVAVLFVLLLVAPGGRRGAWLVRRAVARDTATTWGTSTPTSTVLDDAKAGKWGNVAQAILPLPINPLLDALEQLRDAGLLNAFTKNLSYMPVIRPARFDAALLSITTLASDARLRAMSTLHQLTDDELQAIQARKAAWLAAGTAARARTVIRWDYASFGPWKDAKDTPTQCTEGTFDPSFAKLTPTEWVKGFLDFYRRRARASASRSSGRSPTTATSRTRSPARTRGRWSRARSGSRSRCTTTTSPAWSTRASCRCSSASTPTIPIAASACSRSWSAHRPRG
jgi:hypothetical protein